MAHDEPLHIMSANLEKAKYHFELGLDAINRGSFSQAEEELRIANELAPNRSSILTNLSAVLIQQQNWPQALALCNQLLSIEPKNLEGLINLGICQIQNTDFDKALHSLNQAIEIDSHSTSAWTNKAIALLEQESFQEASECLHTALALNSDFEEALIALGNLHTELKDYAQGIECFSKVLKLNPKNEKAKWNKALALLRVGQFKEGWRLYESRWHALGLDSQLGLNIPLWLGKESLTNKTILIYAEQGYGDTIQFSRYIPKIEALGAKVIFSVPTALVEIMKSISPTISVVVDDSSQLKTLESSIDYQCPIMSLALAFDTDLDSIPNQTPYLSPAPIKRKQWHEKISTIMPLGELPKKILRIGITWTGSGHYAGKKNSKRDIPIDQIAKLINNFQGRPVQFHSLQIEENKNKSLISHCPNLIVHDQDLHSFSDTAALMLELDLIVSIDTATAHLAGALHLPTLLLIADPPDFMSLTDRTDSPWYKKHFLIRSSERKKWDGVLRDTKDLINKALLAI